MKTILGCFGLFVLVLAIDLFCAWLLMLLWNFVVPDVFGGPVLGYWKAFGLLLLLEFVASIFRSKK